MNKIKKPPAYIQAVLDTYPKAVQTKLLTLRQLIFEVAEQDSEIGAIIETLKWNEPAFVTKPKTGTTIRIAWHSKRPNEYGLYVPCTTSLINKFKRKFKNKYTYDGTRGIIFNVDEKPSVSDMRQFIKETLLYHK